MRPSVCGAVGPKAVERVVVEQGQRPADAVQRGFELAHLGARMQPGIDAEAETLRRMVFQPAMRRFANQVAAGKDGRIDLLGTA